MGHSCRTLLWDTLVGQSCGTLLWDTVAGHSCGTLIRDTLVGHSTSVSYETSSKNHTSSLQNERFVRDFLQKSHVKSPKRAFCTRLSSKSHTSSLQNERFVLDILKRVSKTSVSYETSSKESAKRAFRTRHPPKVKRKHLYMHFKSRDLVRHFIEPML